MKRNIISISGTATALEPIHQGGDKTGGTVGEMRRELMRLNDGTFDYVPIISANSIGGILRDMCAFWSLDQIDYQKFSTKSMRAFDLLTSGGGRVVKANDAKYVDLYDERELRELFPSLSLFGGSIGNRMMAGRISIDSWVPVCRQTKPRLPAELHEIAENYDIADMMTELSFSTRDDKKQRVWQDRIDNDALSAWQNEDEKLDKANEAKNKPISMRYGMEALAAGTVFAIGFRFANPSPLDIGCFLGGLSYFAENAKIGGRGNRGFGRVQLDIKQYLMQGFVKFENPLATEAIQVTSEYLQSKKTIIEKMLDAGSI